MRNSCIYKIAGTDTFRLSSTGLFKTKCLVDGRVKSKSWGNNMQNIEKSTRQIYVPDDGKIFVQVDQSGAEALIVAYCCVAGQYRELFKNNVKPHTYLALHLFADVWPRKMMEHRMISSISDFNYGEVLTTPIAQLKDLPYWKNLASLVKSSDDWALTERYYYLAKQTEHSSNYDIKAPMFRMNVLEKSGGKIVISKEDSENFLEKKHGLFPEIRGSYYKYVKNCAENNRVLYNLHGHPFHITDFELDDKKIKELYAWIPQSTVGEITNIAYTSMYHYIVQHNLHWDILANTHDSYLIQCPIGEERECAKKAQEFMNQSFKSPIDGAEFSMKSEAQIGMNWSPYKEGINPNGLKTI